MTAEGPCGGTRLRLNISCSCSAKNRGVGPNKSGSACLESKRLAEPISGCFFMRTDYYQFDLYSKLRSQGFNRFLLGKTHRNRFFEPEIGYPKRI